MSRKDRIESFLTGDQNAYEGFSCPISVEVSMPDRKETVRLSRNEVETLIADYSFVCDAERRLDNHSYLSDDHQWDLHAQIAARQVNWEKRTSGGELKAVLRSVMNVLDQNNTSTMKLASECCSEPSNDKNQDSNVVNERSDSSREATLPYLIYTLAQGTFEEREHVCHDLIQIGTLAIERLVEALNYGGEHSKRVAEGLAEVGEVILEPLAQVLDRVSLPMRVGALRVLGATQNTNAVAVIAPVLADEEEAVRTVASEAIAAMGNAAVPGLVKAMLHKDASVRTYVARLLGKLGDTRAVEKLAQAVGDSERVVSDTAAVALMQIGPVSKLPDMILADTSLEPSKRYSALVNLRQVNHVVSGGGRLKYKFPEVSEFCRQRLESTDVALHTGAKEVWDYITTVRASQATETVPSDNLLLPASEGPTRLDAHEALRASSAPSVSTDHTKVQNRINRAITKFFSRSHAADKPAPTKEPTDLSL